MKILAINSSHRGDKGFTKFLIDKLLKGAIDAGATCETISLANLKINRCISCDVCQTNNLKCIYDDKDDFRSIINKLKETDIIIFATPVYIFSMSGLLKIFLDRLYSTGDSGILKLSKSGLMFHHINESISSKPFVVLVCCDNLENKTPENILSYFKIFSKFMDAKQVGTLIRKSGKMIGHGVNPEKEKMFPKIYDVYKAYYQAGKELALNGKIKNKTQKKANQSILPVPPIINFLMNFAFFKRIMIEKIKAFKVI